MIENIPVQKESPEFESIVAGRLKRYVVENCIFGVDIDPLAVELAKLAVWIETMDRQLPFGFLDHRLKSGNALVGGSLAEIRHYPFEAWFRDTGDEKRTNGAAYGAGHFSKSLKTALKDRIRPELERWITNLEQGALGFDREAEDLESILKRVQGEFEKMRRLPLRDSDRRRELYEQIQSDRALKRLREILDAWCSIWFWDVSILDRAPGPLEWPPNDAETLSLVQSVRDRERHRFFHWELEFPEVFGERKGFDAIVGNPPWETLQPVSKEFFSNLDPLYRGLGKQQALSRQKELFERDPRNENSWIDYVASYNALGNWFAGCACPSGQKESGARPLGRGKKGEHLRTVWESERHNQAVQSHFHHEYSHQGDGKFYTYRLFTEAAYRLLRDGGMLGFIVPSGLYSDKGSVQLREMLLNKCQWVWLFGFINWEQIFRIYYRFKFCILVVKRGGSTKTISAAFGRHDILDWQNAENVAVEYPRERIVRFSPKSKSILEVQTSRDLAILEKMYTNSILLGDQSAGGWRLKYSQGDFNMTTDSKLFEARNECESEGYQANQFGMWVHPEGGVKLPLYEGRMIGHFDFSKKGWVSGKGRTAVWREIPFDAKKIEPQFLVDLETLRTEAPAYGRLKLSFMDIASSTNQRTAIGSLTSLCPNGHSTSVFELSKLSVTQALGLCMAFNSLAYDFAVRFRCSGLHLSYFVVEETPLPVPQAFDRLPGEVLGSIAGLAFPHRMFAPQWLALAKQIPELRSKSLGSLWALTVHERTRRLVIQDAIAAYLYGLEVADFEYILRDCDLPIPTLNAAIAANKLESKGFWRFDKDRAPEFRHTMLALAAFRRLKEVGISAFLKEDWQLPQSAQEYFGVRYLPEQLGEDADKSWAQCELLALELERIVGNVAMGQPLVGEER